MSKYFFYLIIPAALVLGGCTLASSPVETNTSTAKSGFTTISGTVQAQDKTHALIKTSNGTVPVETYSVDFSQYNGQSVTATGKYSGDTLFISEVTTNP